MPRLTKWMPRWMTRTTPQPTRRASSLRVEALERRDVPDIDPVVPLDPPEPLAPAACPDHTEPGIFYHSDTQTVCIVGSDGTDSASVSTSGGYFFASLNADGLLFFFATTNDK